MLTTSWGWGWDRLSCPANLLHSYYFSQTRGRDVKAESHSAIFLRILGIDTHYRAFLSLSIRAPIGIVHVFDSETHTTCWTECCFMQEWKKVDYEKLSLSIETQNNGSDTEENCRRLTLWYYDTVQCIIIGPLMSALKQIKGSWYRYSDEKMESLHSQWALMNLLLLQAWMPLLLFLLYSSRSLCWGWSLQSSC